MRRIPYDPVARRAAAEKLEREMGLSPSPEAECIRCQTVEACTELEDGHVYRPPTWAYPLPGRPLSGVCADCQKQLGVEDDSDQRGST